jgi:hypothetical protein
MYEFGVLMTIVPAGLLTEKIIEAQSSTYNKDTHFMQFSDSAEAAD